MGFEFRSVWAGGLLAISTLLVGAGAAGWFWAQASVAPESGRYTATGISAEIKIVRDRYGVPSISAQSQDDAYFALGFVHAQDRLWQMEWQRRLALGRIAEIVGERGLASDRLARLMGIGRLAEQTAGLLSEDVRAALNAYVAGVNAWLAQARPLPIEFGVMRTRPDPWRAADVLAIWRGLALQLSHNVRSEVLMGRAALRLTPEEMAILFPSGISPLSITLDSESPLERTRNALAFLPPPGASNVWAISGQKTESGKPILANDPHTSFGEPALWYLAHLEAPGLDVTGATIPGFPFTVLGHNAKIAWGMTSNGFDVEDLFIEQIDRADPTRYQTPDGPKPFTIRHETILVAGRAPEELVVRETRHGPVLSDVGVRAAKLSTENTVISLAYSGNVADDLTTEALFRINHAETWADFVEAARHWSTPPQNLVMASTDGTIGLASVGRVPIRKGADGRMPRVGATGLFDWDGVVPFEALPQVLNPPSGRIINANDRVPGARDFQLGDMLDEPLRAQRIAALLDSVDQHRIEVSTAAQLDVFANDAPKLLPPMLRIETKDERSLQALNVLRGWDMKMNPSQAAPLIYVAWLRYLTEALFAEKLGDAFQDYWQVRPRVIADILTNRPEFCSEKVSGCPALLDRTLRDALNELSQEYGADIGRWRWGDAHRAALKHLIYAEVPGLNRLALLSPEVGGGAFTINRGDFSFRNEAAPYAAVFGAEFRAVYDLADLSRSRFVISTGQSGHLLSKHRKDLMALWQDGQSITIRPDDVTGPHEMTVIEPSIR